MKLAFCIFKYFPFGGLQRDFFRILKACIKQGHQIDVYTAQWQGEYPDNINIFVVPVSGWTNHGRMVCFSRKVSSRFIQNSYDRVIGFNKMPNLDWCFVGDVCFKERVSHRRYLSFLPRYRKYLFLEKSIFGPKSKTKIMLLTPMQRHAYEKNYPGVTDRLFLLPSGIPKNKLNEKEMARVRCEIRQSAELMVDESQKLLLFVATDFYNKGLDRVIKSLAVSRQTCSVLLCVIGNDSKRHEFEQLAVRYDVSENIRFLGARENVLEYMFAADLLIHPARIEAAGMVLLEAITAGLPIVTTNICGYAFHVDRSHNGIVLKEPFSQEELDQEVRFLLMEEADKQQFRQHAFEYARHNDFYSLAERAVKLIES